MVDNKSVLELGDISAEAFEALLCYIYTNNTALSLESAFDLLMQADVYLINSLKKFCANFIGEHIDQLNVIDIIKLARELNLPKLEKTATQHIANNLQQYISNEEFHKLVVSDALEVRERQETDTIGIIDDLRYYLNSSSKFSIKHYEENEANLKAINDLLVTLGLGA
ncbi:PREDICTED: ankyrin repeat and BTB/POZ domain-containing protein 1-like [Rhagoletis zephyria]|uniref:ankyrin repeat and BTB/POZ domain-containing protein 1-like n=1 Tax=Rhagoletis zephyria TaxID=28612 RepID=UPI0008114F5D|nr:PREDICTED: ankyrin repeat and BTB/POZ domain-containing protein 1-like [Rhagoletis zephyria]